MFDVPELMEQQERLQDFIRSFGAWGPVIFMSIMALHVLIPPLPSLPLDIAAGAIWGPWYGTLYASVGALIGAVLAFILARYLGQKIVMFLLKKQIKICASCSNSYLTWLVFLSRLLPIADFDIVSYGSGLSQISLKRYAAATFFGMLIPTWLLVTTGSKIVAGDKWILLLGFILAVMFLFVPTFIHRFNLWHPSITKTK